MEEPKVKVKNEEMSQSEFNQLQESLKDDKSQKLKKLGENEYTILSKMKG